MSNLLKALYILLGIMYINKGIDEIKNAMEN